MFTVTIAAQDLILTAPIVTLRRQWTSRTVYLVLLHDRTSILGIGEAAPLPEWGTEDDESILMGERSLTLQLPVTLLPETAQEIDTLLNSISLLNSRPALRFGVETALLDFASRKRTIPVSRLLNSTAQSSVPVSGLFSWQAPATSICDALERGITTLKVKARRDCEEDVKQLKAHAKNYPGLTFRYDCNGGWTVDQALEFLPQFAELPVEYVEQPVSDSDVDSFLESYRDEIPIALDESVNSVKSIDRFLEMHDRIVFVIKPMVLGGISRTLHILNRISAHHRKWVLSSAFDSTIAAAIYAHLAAAAGTRTPQGIATYPMFQSGISSQPLIRDGCVITGDSGLGVEVESARISEVLPWL